MKRSLAFLLLLSVVQVRVEAATTPPINAQTGFAVSMDGGWLAVGSPRDDQNDKDAGAVLLFEREPPCWAFRQKLLAADPRPGALFGSAVSLRGESSPWPRPARKRSMSSTMSMAGCRPLA